MLVVDDERDLADLMVEVLHLEGYEARCAVGQTAIETMEGWVPEVLILDLMMPEVSGFDVARMMRERETLAAVPIVIVTAMARPADHAEKLGTPHILAKPFDVTELLAVVEAAGAQ